MAAPTKEQKTAAANLLDEFDVHRYKDCSKLSLMDWYFLLGSRADLYNKPLPPETDNLVCSLLSAPLSHGRNNARVSLSSPAPITDMQVFGAMYNAHVMRCSVPALAEDVAQFIAGTEPKLKDGETYRYTVPPPELNRSFVDAVLDETDSEHMLYATEYAQLTVNLAATDDAITKEFKVWLAAARKRREHTNPHKLRSANWAVQRVLPYIDLTIIAKRYCVELTRRNVCDAIWPDADKDLQSTVAGLKSRATELLSPSYRASILAAAQKPKG